MRIHTQHRVAQRRLAGWNRRVFRKLPAVFALVLVFSSPVFSEKRMPTSAVLQAVSLDEVLTVSGISEIRTTLPIVAHKDTLSGVYVLQASACADARQDRYEIVFDRNVEHIFGLGSKKPEDKPELSDFRDDRFSVGHYNYPAQPWEADAGRMRTPIFVLPTEGLIVAYLQPQVKQVQLSRAEDTTTILMRKHEDYPEGACAPYIVVKGSTAGIADAYARLYTYLNAATEQFKRPHWNAFGLGWETFPAIGCDTSLAKVETAYADYADNGIKLSFLIVGSGYWNSNNVTGCGPTTRRDVEDPTMDALAVNPNFVSTEALNRFFVELASQDVYPMLGMRHTVPPRNVSRIESLLQSQGQVYLDDNLYYGGEPSNHTRLLNVTSEAVISRYIDLLHAAYGSFKGIKEDEMLIGDQQAFVPTIGVDPSEVQNFADGTLRDVYGKYTSKHDGDFIVDGRNDWFSVGTDIQNGPGYIPGRTPSGYYLKDEIDAALTMVMSGYPHPKIELHRPQSGDPMEIFRGIQALTFMPVTSQSINFTNITDPDLKDAAIYFSRLRNVLHQYAFDHAQNWYTTGVPSLMRPLYIDYPQDERAYNLYAGPVGPARNQFMMGNALLVRPILSASDALQTYLPAGRWKPLLKNAPSLSGGRYITYALQDHKDFPVLVKEGEIFILGAEDESSAINAHVFLEGLSSSKEYSVYRNDGTILARLKADKSGQSIVFTDSISGRTAIAVLDRNGFYTIKVSDLVPTSASPTPSPMPSPTPSPSPTAAPTPSASPAVTRAWLPLLSDGQPAAGDPASGDTRGSQRSGR